MSVVVCRGWHTPCPAAGWGGSHGWPRGHVLSSSAAVARRSTAEQHCAALTKGSHTVPCTHTAVTAPTGALRQNNDDDKAELLRPAPLVPYTARHTWDGHTRPSLNKSYKMQCVALIEQSELASGKANVASRPWRSAAAGRLQVAMKGSGRWGVGGAPGADSRRHHWPRAPAPGQLTPTPSPPATSTSCSSVCRPASHSPPRSSQVHSHGQLHPRPASSLETVPQQSTAAEQSAGTTPTDVHTRACCHQGEARLSFREGKSKEHCEETTGGRQHVELSCTVLAVPDATGSGNRTANRAAAPFLATANAQSS